MSYNSIDDDDDDDDDDFELFKLSKNPSKSGQKRMCSSVSSL